MSSYLLASCPIAGHVAPLVAIGEDLVARGHSVVLLTGSRFAEQAEAVGVEHVSLPEGADFDDRDRDEYIPDRDRYTGLARSQYEVQGVFVSRLAAQFRGLSAVMETAQPDAIVSDGAFAGALPLLLRPRADRPPVFGAGLFALSQSDPYQGPYGSGLAPSTSLLGQVRNRVMQKAARVLFRKTQAVANAQLAELGLPPTKHFIMDISSLYDRFLQLSTETFDYPRKRLASNTVYVGPVVPSPPAAPTPPWWGDLDADVPVVHATQGTIDNVDFSRLILPTVQALADESVLVVVTGGGASVAELGALPANVRAADFLSYSDLMPRLTALVTNGGYGTVQYALAHGVPMVVAGDTEDKPEVAGRVAYCGAGIDLGTGSPDASEVRAAVLAVLDDNRYREGARRLAADFAARDALQTIADELASAHS